MTTAASEARIFCASFLPLAASPSKSLYGQRRRGADFLLYAGNGLIEDGDVG